MGKSHSLIKPLKVCIFTETYSPVVGGGETQAQLLAEGLIANGHSALILTRKSDRGLKKSEQIGSVPVYRIPPAGTGQLKKWGLIFSSLPALIKLRRQYDIIFVSGFRIIGVSAVLFSKLFRKKCILKADSQGEMSGEFFKNGLANLGLSYTWLPFRIFLWLRNKILITSDAFSAITEDTALELVSSGIPAHKIYRIPNSVDTIRFCRVTSEHKALLRMNLGIPSSATVVTYTGRLVSYKGLPILLNVWRDICRKHNDVRLLLVGTGGLDIHNCEAELRSFVNTHGLEQYVQFTDSVKNVEEYLQSSDIFAFPTENDAFPSSLIEAMACGLPVVTTPVGAIPTIVTDMQNGIVVQSGDFDKLYQALDTLILDQDLATRLGRVAWKTVQDLYTSEIVNKKYLTLFHDTANR